MIQLKNIERSYNDNWSNRTDLADHPMSLRFASAGAVDDHE